MTLVQIDAHPTNLLHAASGGEFDPKRLKNSRASSGAFEVAADVPIGGPTEEKDTAAGELASSLFQLVARR